MCSFSSTELRSQTVLPSQSEIFLINVLACIFDPVNKSCVRLQTSWINLRQNLRVTLFSISMSLIRILLQLCNHAQVWRYNFHWLFLEALLRVAYASFACRRCDEVFVINVSRLTSSLLSHQLESHQHINVLDKRSIPWGNIECNQYSWFFDCFSIDQTGLVPRKISNHPIDK